MRRIAAVVLLVLVACGPSAATRAAAAVPDDSWVVFATDDGGIGASHPDGRDRRVVTPRPTTPAPNGVPYVDIAPDLAADGSKVAFISCSPTTGHPLKACEVWTVRFDGSGLRHVPLRAEGEGQVTSAAWSPDGRQLAVGRVRSDGGTVSTVANEEGTAERDVAYGDRPDWAPDGGRLAYGAADGLRVVTLTDGTTRLLTSFGGLPSWSPDGQHIAFVGRVGIPPHTEEHYAVVHPDGSGLRTLGKTGSPWTPQWSPDSRTLATVGYDDAGTIGTTYVDLAGNEVGRQSALITGWANPSGVRSCAAGSRLAARDGAVFALGTAVFHGSLSGARLNAPVAGIAAAPGGDGYWLLGGDGGIFTFGPGARFFGSTGDRRLNAPVLAMSVTTTGVGYWLVAGDGGIFTFGDAPFLGSTGDRRLNQPVVALATSPSGNGYWLVARDGGIFTFGDAGFFGSTGSLQLQSPIVAMVPTNTGQGYWLVAADGGVFTFGDAVFPGSAALPGLGSPVVSAAPSRDGGGFTMATADGQIVAMGDAEFCGSRVGQTRLPAGAIVGIAA